MVAPALLSVVHFLPSAIQLCYVTHGDHTHGDHTHGEDMIFVNMTGGE